jgi:ComF family protein
MAHTGAELLKDADIIIPIPLHWSRLWRRRFNQAMVLAQSVVMTHNRDAPIPIGAHLLKRIKRTEHQTGLTRTRRAANLRGAFAVPERAKAILKNKRIVLIDDVLTTGATVNAATRTLLKAGVAQVDVLTFARVTLGDDDPTTFI